MIWSRAEKSRLRSERSRFMAARLWEKGYCRRFAIRDGIGLTAAQTEWIERGAGGYESGKYV